jgi:hypothetical protein
MRIAVQLREGLNFGESGVEIAEETSDYLPIGGHAVGAESGGQDTEVSWPLLGRRMGDKGCRFECWTFRRSARDGMAPKT